MRHDADYWIKYLKLDPHPEGGYFKETYRAMSEHGQRAASTGIYFLLKEQDVSHFHRIDSDEMWHFYAGDNLVVHMIDREGHYSSFRLGSDPDNGAVFQAVVPAGYWFGAELEGDGEYGLVGCTVAPGFEFSMFELAVGKSLIKQYPQHEKLILKLT